MVIISWFKSGHHAVNLKLIQCVNYFSIKLEKKKQKLKGKDQELYKCQVTQGPNYDSLVILIQRRVTAATENLGDCDLLYSPALREMANWFSDLVILTKWI